MRDRPIPREFTSPGGWAILAWGLSLLLAAGAMALWQQRSLTQELERESGVLNRLVSQRAGQHDAHLTALSAIASASAGPERELFLDVASTITHFYPRIDDVQLVPLDPRDPVIGTGPLAPEVADLIRDAARASTGGIALMPYPGRAHHYMMVKRSPNVPEARFGLMLGIDAEKLLDEAGVFWRRPGVVLALAMPDGRLLAGQDRPSGAVRSGRVIGSASQTLILETGLDVGWADRLPLAPAALLFAFVSLAYWTALGAWRQRTRTRAVAEQARINALESRLAHASRVNALGEMASGLTHELTQPLTAILAQAQAGKRLAAQGRGAALESVLDGTIAQARRASAILERFRDWSRPRPASAAAFDLRDAVRNVQALLAPEAASGGARIDCSVPGDPVPVRADPVEMEQAAFNLVRNAIEAVAGRPDARIAIDLRSAAGRAVLDVSDNGPGVPPGIRTVLFTPFATTREGGMGLGLALSRRLVERGGGDLDLADGAGTGATFRISIPLAGDTEEDGS
ncbi:sensor histidine kinase [Castellaniella denitrificans]|uniref:histidine kinase n=2 Tax=Pseudomonadota TaxID=1224 RepID=A0ABT4M586_9BURK|nr:ATP-binding protein [Castellaniella denitrificans]MCZ4330498.1 ATP-binding protein [Castellaniella denitrificans]